MITAVRRQIIWDSRRSAVATQGEHSGYGINGLLVQRIGGVLHGLVRSARFRGTVHCSSSDRPSRGPMRNCRFSAADAPPFLEYFQSPPSSCSATRPDTWRKGARFMHLVSAYVLVELPLDVRLRLPENYCFMTFAQLSALNAYGGVNIEARNLLSCISLFD
ncbi:NDP-hexose 2,3-dehydratase family protein [Bradyrhizobium sp. DASA03120]|uniref:NDP-hexose 2,3-dehydratase family protein n=1 Tax=Bradyrhizobium sp. SMVTL-02 TaxID=3395917 RepID=UPI003F7107BF